MTTKDWRTLYKEDGENIVVLQSWWNQIPSLLFTAIVTGSLLFLTWHYPELTYLSSPFFGIELRLPILVLVPLGLLCFIGHKVIDDRLVLTPDYILMIDGLASWRKCTLRLEYYRVHEIEIDDTLWQQALGLGDIRIIPVAMSHSHSGGILRLDGVRQPRLLKDIIVSRIRGREKRLNERTQEMSSDL